MKQINSEARVYTSSRRARCVQGMKHELLCHGSHHHHHRHREERDDFHAWKVYSIFLRNNAKLGNARGQF